MQCMCAYFISLLLREFIIFAHKKDPHIKVSLPTADSSGCWMPALRSGFVFVLIRQEPSSTAFTDLFQSSHRMWWFGYFGLFPLHFIVHCSVCTVTLATLSTVIGFRAKKPSVFSSSVFSLTACVLMSAVSYFFLILSGQQFHLLQRSAWQHCYLLLLLEFDSSSLKRGLCTAAR